MNFIGHRYILIEEVKEILDRMIFIHNGAFLNYEDNKEEKQEALEVLENIVRKLGTALEKYKTREINTKEMEDIYTVCKKSCRNIIVTYPWLSKFDLLSGIGFNYHKYFKRIEKIKYNAIKDKLIK
ncbi:hypothetical protein ACED96_05335 [Clostridium thermobutyricum]